MAVAHTTFARLPPLLRALVEGDERTAGRLIRVTPPGSWPVVRGWAWLPKLGIAIVEGDTVLHVAARRTSSGIVRLLLRLGADPDAGNRHGHRPLHAAVSCLPEWSPDVHRRQADIVRLLVKAGAHPDGRDLRGVAPIHTAVRVRCVVSVRALLGAGASLRARNGATGATPLHLAVRTTGRGGAGGAAARAAQRAIIALLRRRGARPSDRDRRGRTVTDWARGTAAEGGRLVGLK